MRPVIFVHGGAGNDYDDRVDLFRRGVENAARAGWEILAQGGSALDAVETAVRVMEDDPVFDSGHGSFLNQMGEVELDALIMEGSALGSGAVAGIQRVSNPISVARMVMERSPHSLFVGAGAEAFARAQGVPVCPMEELVSQSSTHQLRPEDRTYNPKLHPQDTVGVVALDEQGLLAAGTSTGGTAGKMPGRVGDSPIIGCGAYADNELGAASATGHGESLMKLIFSKSACDLVGSGFHPQQAAEEMLQRLEKRTGSQGGLILLGPTGEIGCAFNTHHMARAWVAGDGQVTVMD